jgi:hypothetical protein
MKVTAIGHDDEGLKTTEDLQNGILNCIYMSCTNHLAAASEG